jgi:hypothetical protein
MNTALSIQTQAGSVRNYCLHIYTDPYLSPFTLVYLKELEPTMIIKPTRRIIGKLARNGLERICKETTVP